MKKTQNHKDYIECPTCRQKYFVPLNSIPKSRFIQDYMETTRNKLDKSKLSLPQNNQTNLVTESVRSQLPRSPQEVQIILRPGQAHSSNISVI